MDRNLDTMQVVVVVVESLSARRAWIEIDIDGKLDADLWVALRKESVDRNLPTSRNSPQRLQVALRKESVDRNRTTSSA